MLKEKTKKRIIYLLESEEIGLSQRKIAEILQLSRPTVSKYIKALVEENLVKEVKVGDMRVWTINRIEEMQINPMARVVFIFFKALVQSIMDYAKNEKNEILDENYWCKIGRMMSDRIEFIKIAQTNQWEDVMQKKSSEFLEKIYALKEMIITVFKVIDDCSIDPPVIITESEIAVLRLKNISHYDRPEIYHILCGTIEREVNKTFNTSISLSVNVNVKEKIVDVKISFN